MNNYLAATHEVLRATPAFTRAGWSGKRQRLPGGIPHRFISQPVRGPQCATVTVQIRDEDLKTVLALGERMAMRTGSNFARIFRDGQVIRIEYTLPPEQWTEVPFEKLPHHATQPTFGQQARGPIARMSFDISPHKLVCGSSQTGKTVCLADIMLSLIKTNQPEELRLLIINPKNDDRLRRFARVPHLGAKVAVEYEDCSNLFRLAIGEMEVRKTDKARMSQRWVIIADEVAELVQVDEAVGPMITRLGQMAGGLNINLIAATQAPNPAVFGKKGTLAKANLGSRLVFQLPNEMAWLATGVSGIKTDGLGYKNSGKGDGLAISNGIVTRFRAALPNENDFASLPGCETEPDVPDSDLLAGDATLTGYTWAIDDLADRLAFAAEVNNSATAILGQFKGSAARAGWVRDLHKKFLERQEYWRWNN